MSSESDLTNLGSAALWCLEHFVAADRANAAMHCATVRYSPITFRLAASLGRVPGYCDSVAVATVLADLGKYTLDPGR